jgi:hypothetical protein
VTAPQTVAQGMQRTGWLKTLLKWHWISSALCLVAMILFAVTGITLNHASQLESKPQVVRLKATAPQPALAEAAAFARVHDGAKGSVTPQMAAWLASAWKVNTAGAQAEWSADELYVPMPRPGGDAWVRVGLQDGAAEFESTDRGWISLLNDLHKGRNAGTAWSLFLDLFAVSCLVFCVTGLLILKMHAQNRAITWPLVGFGLLLPVVIALLFIH